MHMASDPPHKWDRIERSANACSLVRAEKSVRMNRLRALCARDLPDL